MSDLNLRYVYQPISLPSGFRLLKLDTSNTSLDSPVEYSLLEYELADNKYPAFTTLSYAWGTTDLHHSVRVDGKEVMITANLHVALQQLREYQQNGTTPTSFWWIDLICINQYDIEERGQQVAMMRDIYHRSKLTVAWLGPARDDSDSAMRNLNEMTLNKQNPDPLRKLLTRPYFSRVWVIQEVCVSSQVLLACGAVTIPWPSQVQYLTGASCFSYGEPHYLRVLYDLRKAYRNPHFPSFNLQFMIKNAYLSACTDSRDMVYALLGLARAGCGATVIQPDYSKCDCAVFCLAIRAMYQDMGQDRLEKDRARVLEKAGSGGHNPFIEDDSIRGNCVGSGNGCKSYAACLSVATEILYV